MRRRSVLALALLSIASAAAAAEETPARGGSAAAVEIARASQPHWRLGQLTLRTRDARPAQVRAELLAGARLVARLRIDPATGGFLARDEGGHPSMGAPELERLKGAAERELARLEVGGWAWPSEHGRAWGVPLRYQGRVVGRLKVDVQQGRVLGIASEDRDDDD